MRPHGQSFLVSMVSAGLRHARDAEVLLTDSPDQAWHLAGFGPECLRKAVLTLPWISKALGHSTDGADRPLLELAFSLDAKARQHAGLVRLDSLEPLRTWSPNHRYEATGTRAALASELVAQCRTEVDRRCAQLFAAGLPLAEVP